MAEAEKESQKESDTQNEFEQNEEKADAQSVDADTLPHVKSEDIEEDETEKVEAKEDTLEEEETEKSEEEEEGPEKLFQLRFHITEEELYLFHIVTGSAQMQKTKKSMRMMGIVMLVVGIFYGGFLYSKAQALTPIQALMTVLLVGMGIYSLTYYRFFFEKQLRKSVKRSHSKTPYFQSEIKIDVYPNKFVEVIDDKEAATYWRTILKVIESSELYVIFLGEKRCLLLPKRGIRECGLLEQFDSFLNEICENFEKPRSQYE